MWQASWVVFTPQARQVSDHDRTKRLISLHRSFFSLDRLGDFLRLGLAMTLSPASAAFSAAFSSRRALRA